MINPNESIGLNDGRFEEIIDHVASLYENMYKESVDHHVEEAYAKIRPIVDKKIELLKEKIDFRINSIREKYKAIIDSRVQAMVQETIDKAIDSALADAIVNSFFNKEEQEFIKKEESKAEEKTTTKKEKPVVNTTDSVSDDLDVIGAPAVNAEYVDLSEYDDEDSSREVIKPKQSSQVPVKEDLVETPIRPPMTEEEMDAMFEERRAEMRRIVDLEKEYQEAMDKLFEKEIKDAEKEKEKMGPDYFVYVTHPSLYEQKRGFPARIIKIFQDRFGIDEHGYYNPLIDAVKRLIIRYQRCGMTLDKIEEYVMFWMMQYAPHINEDPELENWDMDECIQKLEKIDTKREPFIETDFNNLFKE